MSFKECRAVPKKVPEKRRKRKAPSTKTRGSISKTEYNRMIEAFGCHCVICGDPRIEAHHVRFRSQGGRGKWRNLAPLCRRCHQAVHQNRAFAERLMAMREDMFGKWYWADEYDLYERGLIKEPTKEKFEAFMRSEENEEMVRHRTGKEVGGW